MIGIDLFAGAGGMSLGATMAGVQVLEAVEVDSNAATTYAANHGGVVLHVDDIRVYSPRREALPDDEVIVFGGPPCQGFSTSNQRNRTALNPRNWLFREFLRVVHELEPEWVVIENVSGMLQTEGGIFVTAIEDDLSDLGYTVTRVLLNAAEFGIPQRRSRLFFIGSRAGQTVTLANATEEEVTVWEAICDLPSLDNGAAIDRLPYRTAECSAYASRLRQERGECGNHLVTRNAPHILERYEHVPQGGNWEHIPSSLMQNYKDRSGCHTGIYHRLRPDAPAKVIGNFRKNMLIHPHENRGLSVREAARLQSFPDWFEFKGSIGFQQQQVGNAVPPLLAHAVFQAVVGAR
ncbi:MAG: DNA cytosine methyltransferase [Planctomycetota bacterium]